MLAKKIGASKVTRWTGIPETSVRRWVKTGSDRVGKNGHKPQYLPIEEELVKLFVEYRVQGFQITNKILLLEARKIASQKGLIDFTGSQSWLEGFKKRNRIVYRRQTRIAQKLKPDTREKLAAFQSRFLELTQEHQYPISAIVNIDETRVTFDSPSNFTLDIQVCESFSESGFIGESMPLAMRRLWNVLLAISEFSSRKSGIYLINF